MSYYYPETTGAVSVSPKRHEEDDEYEEEEELEEESEEAEAEAEEEEEEEEDAEEEEEEDAEEEEEEESEDEEEEEEEEERKELSSTRAREVSVRFAIILFWILALQLVSSTILTCITGLIVNSAKCFGAIIGLAIFILPAAYAISPEHVCSFKFRSLAPTIADGLYKLDYFVKRLVRAIGDKLKLKQV
jgi:cation transport ATPase